MTPLLLALQVWADGVPYHTQRPAGSKLAVDSAAYFHPFTTPKGVVLTDVAPDDHKHHRGIFFAWVEMHGKKDADFWGWGQHAPKDKRVIVNRSAREESGGLVVTNDWMAEDVAVLTEVVEAKAAVVDGLRILDLTYTLTPAEEVVVARWAFSGFCVRTRKDAKITAEGPEGAVKRPAPKHTDPASNWPDQPWYGFTMDFKDGAQAGVAVVGHPKNPPTTWHVATGIGMINPAVCAPAKLTLAAKAPFVTRYKVVAWDGPAPRERLNALVTK